MTLAEFKYLLTEDAGILNSGNLVVTLFNQYPGSTTRIDAIALRITENRPLITLQNATLLSIQDTTDGSLYYLPVVSSLNPVRIIDKEVVENYYLYTISPENQRPIIQNPITGSDGIYDFIGNVIIEPVDSPVAFLYNDYNPFIGNVQENRSSQYRSVSDRVASTLSPTNLASILADVAIKATVQDSNYSSTGWTNARYEGSKITTATNFGVDPILQGVSFQGALFSLTATDTYINNLSDSDIKYSQYISSGELIEPRYVVEKTGLEASTTLAIGAEYLTFKNTSGDKLLPIKVGDLLITSSSLFQKEIVQVKNPSTAIYYPYEDISTDEFGTTYTLYVQRGYDGTPQETLPSTSNLYRIVTTRIYNVATVGTETIQAGKVKVQGVDEILYTDLEGLVVSGSNRYLKQDL